MLMRAAPKMQRLEGLEDGYDVRDLVAKAVSRAYKAYENGDGLNQAAGQTDMFERASEDTATREIIKLFANSKSAKDIADKLGKMADRLYNTAQQAAMGGDLFGPVEVPPRDEIIKRALAGDAALFRHMSPGRVLFWHKYGGAILRTLFS